MGVSQMSAMPDEQAPAAPETTTAPAPAPHHGGFHFPPHFPPHLNMMPPQHAPPPPYFGHEHHFGESAGPAEYNQGYLGEGPAEYRGFQFVPRSSQGNTHDTACPYYGFHDFPPGCGYQDPKISAYPSDERYLDKQSLFQMSHLPQPIPDIDEEQEAMQAIKASRTRQPIAYPNDNNASSAKVIDAGSVFQPANQARYRKQTLQASLLGQSERGIREGSLQVGSFRMAFEDAVAKERTNLCCAVHDHEAALAAKFGPNTHGTVIGAVTSYNDHPYGGWDNMGRHPVGFGHTSEYGVLPHTQRYTFHESYAAPAAYPEMPHPHPTLAAVDNSGGI